MLTTGDKFLAMGLPLKEVIADMTWHPAIEVQQKQLGNLSEGAIADVAVINLQHGDFGLADGSGALMKAHDRMTCELTIKDGKFVYDLNARSSDPWDHPPTDAAKQSAKWTKLRAAPFGGAQRPIQQTAAGQAQIAAQAQAVAANGQQQRRPARWQPYDTDANGKATVKANAKLAPAGTKVAAPKVPPPASTWATPPSFTGSTGQ